MNYIAPRAEPLIREIPLSRLSLAPENVRMKLPDPEADAAITVGMARMLRVPGRNAQLTGRPCRTSNASNE